MIPSPLFKGYPLQVRQKQDWGRGFIRLLPQTAALPESDAGSDAIKPASSFVIQNHQTSCSMWCPMYRARSWNMVCGLLRGACLGTKAWSLEAFSQYSVFHLFFVHSETRMPSLARLFKRFHAAGTNGRLDVSLTWRVFEDPLKRPCKI